MNIELLDANWRTLDTFTQKALKDYARFGTESNNTYITGYLGALADRGLLTDPGYWLAVVNTPEAMKHIRRLPLEIRA